MMSKIYGRIYRTLMVLFLTAISAAYAGADAWVYECHLIIVDGSIQEERCKIVAHEHPHPGNRPGYEVRYFPGGITSSPSDSISPSIGIQYEGVYDVTIYITRFEYGPDDEGNECDTGTPANGIVTKVGSGFHCLQDLDDDGIVDWFDDCPFNADNSHCSDLPDCDAAVGYALGTLGVTGGMLFSAGMHSIVTTTTVIGGAVATVTAAVGGVAAGVAIVGGAYCLVSELEN